MRTILKVNRYWGMDLRPLAAYVNHDAVIERQWRAKVANNPKEIARLRKQA